MRKIRFADWTVEQSAADVLAWSCPPGKEVADSGAVAAEVVPRAVRVAEEHTIRMIAVTNAEEEATTLGTAHGTAVEEAVVEAVEVAAVGDPAVAVRVLAPGSCALAPGATAVAAAVTVVLGPKLRRRGLLRPIIGRAAVIAASRRDVRSPRRTPGAAQEHLVRQPDQDPDLTAATEILITIEKPKAPATTTTTWITTFDAKKLGRHLP